MSYHNSTLQNTSVHVPGVPSDDDLYDAGWAKHWDAGRKAYYYYPIDGGQATTWENPLRNTDASTNFASFAGASFAMQSVVASIKEEHSDDSDESSSSSFDANEASFYGDSQVSLTLSTLMGMNSRRTLQTNKSARTLNTNNKSAATTPNASAATGRMNATANTQIDASQTIQEEASDNDSFQTETTPFTTKSQPETFEDEPTQRTPTASVGTAERSFGGTARTPLRKPRPKSKTSPSTEDSELVKIEREIEEAVTEMEDRERDYLHLFEQERQRFKHTKFGPAKACCLLLLIVAGLGVGGYFLVDSLLDQAEDLESSIGTEDATNPPTTAPLALPDYTEEALLNPVSFQALAINWLRDDPNYHTYPKAEKEARFALMAIYTATGGSNWGRRDSFTLPESSYQMASHCDFPYYTCPGYVPSVTFAPIAGLAVVAPAPTAPAPAPVGNTTNAPAVTPIENNATAAPGGRFLLASTQSTSEQQRQSQRELYFDGAFAAGTILNLTNQGLLQGTLPPEMALLTELQTVQVSNNRGLIGSIPDSIRFWQDFLFTLILTGNSLSGTIPTILGRLRHVRTLHLNDNQLTGMLPDQLSFLTQMTSLQLQNNMLTGTVPPGLATYPYVMEVNWANNQLRGSLPTFYVEGALASQVQRIILHNNSFSGSIPTQLGGLTNLQVLQLHNNLALIGGVPTEICSLPKLQEISVDCNTVACACPQCSCPTGGAPRTNDLINALPAYSNAAIRDSNSPQGLAYAWLYSDPELATLPLEQQLQRFALASLYYSTTQPPDYQSWGVSTNWLDHQGSDECTWASTAVVFYRVPDATMENLTNCVAVATSSGQALESYQSLRLANNTLAGTFPPEVAMLTNLKRLELHGNNLVGSIPSYLNTLTALNVFDLESNGITGTIPTQLMDLSMLNKLYLGDNSLQGPLPSELGKLTVLDTLQLNGNQFTGGLPYQLSLLGPTLQRLYLSSNFLAGPLPVPAITAMTSLVELYLDNNNLNGTLEALPFTAAPSLAHVVVSANDFTGTIPTLFGSMASIQVLLLDQNQFVGPIPVELVGASQSLQWLHVGSNLLTGTVPTQIGLLNQLVVFDVSNNKLLGTIPTELNQCVRLSLLDLSTNRLNGSIPPELLFFPGLTKLKIDHNDLVGTLPTELSSLSDTLTWLEVSWNALGGNVPTELGVLSNLEWLYLERNNMNGPIPLQLGRLTALKELSMYGMQLTGNIPSELGLLSTSLTALFLHENYFEGQIPSELGLLTRMSSLWLHQLSLTGTVPAELCNLKTSGTLQTLAVDCQKVSCTCGCSCPTEGGDAPKADPTLEGTAQYSISKAAKDGSSGNIFRHRGAD